MESRGDTLKRRESRVSGYTSSGIASTNDDYDWLQVEMRKAVNENDWILNHLSNVVLIVQRKLGKLECLGVN